ncbi:MAG: hypothetical protein M3O22_03810 [Pseudomonadota bacterium]|nr:hypothetical protein [Pseudomonadota bacterium]
MHMARFLSWAGEAPADKIPLFGSRFLEMMKTFGLQGNPDFIAMVLPFIEPAFALFSSHPAPDPAIARKTGKVRNHLLAIQRGRPAGTPRHEQPVCG